uniref:Uncharacterized protein n=1 Tax=Cacopsylla melanoneura TaxID=428564 RepID=A0A8D8W518_9HEMI
MLLLKCHKHNKCLTSAANPAFAALIRAASSSVIMQFTFRLGILSLMASKKCLRVFASILLLMQWARGYPLFNSSTPITFRSCRPYCVMSWVASMMRMSREQDSISFICSLVWMPRMNISSDSSFVELGPDMTSLPTGLKIKIGSYDSFFNFSTKINVDVLSSGARLSVAFMRILFLSRIALRERKSSLE